MALRLNMTYIYLSGHVELHRHGHLYFVIMLTAYVLIICFNVSIISLIVIHKDLHEPMYIFIAALLANSVLLSTNIYPKLLVDFLSQNQIISYRACLFQVFIFYSLSISEFLLLAVMAYDRYVSICKPLQYPTIMTKATLSVLLVLAWTLPACYVAVPAVRNINRKLCRFTLKAIFCNITAHTLYCESSEAFSIYSLVVSNVGLIPVFFIVFTYTKILVITYKRFGGVRKVTQTCLPHLLVLTNFSVLIIYDNTIVRVGSHVPEMVQLVMTLLIIVCQPLFNPVIYGLKMRKITEHLKRFFSQAKVN